MTAALDAGYISEDAYKKLDAMAISVIGLVNGYIRSTKNLNDSAAAKMKG